MIVQQTYVQISTRGRGFYPLTERVNAWLRSQKLQSGLCLVFLQHTSASLCVTENADPDVRRDLEAWMSRTVKDGDPSFQHDAEGPDDMAAHLRQVLTDVSLTLPVAQGKLDLGTWQGVYLWEHRYAAHTRRISLTAMGVSQTG